MLRCFTDLGFSVSGFGSKSGSREVLVSVGLGFRAYMRHVYRNPHLGPSRFLLG